MSQKDDTISRQEAINALNVGAELLRRVLDDADVVGAERAKYEWGLGLIESYISDIEELPSVQPECDDTVSRKAEIDAIKRYIRGFDAIDVNFLDGLKTAIQIIEQLPHEYSNAQNTLQRVGSVECEDTISRHAAIDALGKDPGFKVRLFGRSYDEGRSDQWFKDVYKLTTLPSAQPEILAHGEGELSSQPEQRWIPCEERLPENRVYVLVTYRYEYGLIDHGITWYGEAEKKWNTSREVIAWKPLPEPWKEEQPC